MVYRSSDSYICSSVTVRISAQNNFTIFKFITKVLEYKAVKAGRIKFACIAMYVFLIDEFLLK